MTPPGGYFGGNVYLTLINQEAGVDLYLNYDGKNIVPTYGTKMSVKTGLEFILTVVPKENSYNTSFSFDYSTDGTKNSDAKIFIAL